MKGWSGQDGATPSIERVVSRGVRVPLNIPLGTSAAEIRSVPLLLVDLHLEGGVVGRSYQFCYTEAGARAVAAHLDEAVKSVIGQGSSPQRLGALLARRLALPGVTGTLRMALSILDVALWDALAVAAALPLAVMLGGSVRPIPAYDSRGLGLMAPDRLAQEAERLLESGLPALKLRLGYPEMAGDLAALRTVRRSIPDSCAIMVDYNQALTPAEALLRGRALEAEGVLWIEEPVRHDDYRASAALAQALTTPVQIGENLNGPAAMLEAIRTQACDYLMPDLTRIGGVTGWMQAAGIASAAGIELSSHLMPEISAHLLAASPTARWLEYVDWADAVLAEPLVLRDGTALIPDRPGLGIVWDEGKIGRLDSI